MRDKTYCTGYKEHIHTSGYLIPWVIRSGVKYSTFQGAIAYWIWWVSYTYCAPAFVQYLTFQGTVAYWIWWVLYRYCAPVLYSTQRFKLLLRIEYDEHHTDTAPLSCTVLNVSSYYCVLDMMSIVQILRLCVCTVLNVSRYYCVSYRYCAPVLYSTQRFKVLLCIGYD
jgi:hypothetical protein